MDLTSLSKQIELVEKWINIYVSHFKIIWQLFGRECSVTQQDWARRSSTPVVEVTQSLILIIEAGTD